MNKKVDKFFDKVKGKEFDLSDAVFLEDYGLVTRMIQVYADDSVKQKVDSISDKIQKHMKTMKYFKGDKMFRRYVYMIEEKDLKEILKQ